jgi:hypothetical protein
MAQARGLTGVKGRVRLHFKLCWVPVPVRRGICARMRRAPPAPVFALSSKKARDKILDAHAAGAR